MTLKFPLDIVLSIPHTAIVVSGKDRKSFLQGLLTNDINQDSVLRSLFTDHRGRILLDCWLQQQPNAIYLYVEQGLEQQLLDLLDFYKIIEEVEVQQADAGVGFYYRFVEDPSLHTIQKPAYQEAQFGLHMINAQENWQQHFVQSQIVDQQQFSDIAPIFGWARLQQDYDQKNFPQEASLGHLVSYTKGCFVGQEPLARLHHKGRVTKSLQRFLSPEPLKPTAGLLLNKQKVGQVTTASNCETVQGFFSLGFLKQKLQSAEVDLRAENGTAEGVPIKLVPLN